jgi:hypothetical protein
LAQKGTKIAKNSENSENRAISREVAKRKKMRIIIIYLTKKELAPNSLLTLVKKNC